MSATYRVERADLLETLGKHRGFLRHTVRELTDEQAAGSAHGQRAVPRRADQARADTERAWIEFIVERSRGDGAIERLVDGPTASGCSRARRWPAMLDKYEEVARRTDELVATLPDLDARIRCPRRRGSRPARPGRRAACSCTSSPRPPSTPATPTSSGDDRRSKTMG